MGIVNVLVAVWPGLNAGQLCALATMLTDPDPGTVEADRLPRLNQAGVAAGVPKATLVALRAVIEIGVE